MEVKAGRVAAPGRVVLIGEHIDYHNLSVLPMALERRVVVNWRARTDSKIRATSLNGFPAREFEWTDDLKPGPAGDWENYLRAAAHTVHLKWGRGVGIDAEVNADLPPAAGLSSSSALLVAFTLALLRANGKDAGFEALMEVLPEGEHFVGTRGGGMDHAASMGSRAGCASLIGFAPATIETIPIPEGWGFLVAHSLKIAEKSGAVREEYNARRAAGMGAPGHLGFESYRQLVAGRTREELEEMAARLSDVRERECFLHTVTENLRVQDAVAAMRRGDAETFGKLLLGSHASLRDWLRVSCAELDELVDAAMASGATGARLTGAGFGGCAVVFMPKTQIDHVKEGLRAQFYASRPAFHEDSHLITAVPGDGALILSR